MATRYDLTVEGKPLSQQRPMVTRSGHTVSNRGPNRVWMEKVREHVRRQWFEKGKPEPIESCSLTLEFTIPIANKKKWGEKHVSRPDIDNIAKLVMDAMGSGRRDVLYNGILKDDSVVHSLTVKKVYGKVGSVRIIVEDDEDDEPV